MEGWLGVGEELLGLIYEGDCVGFVSGGAGVGVLVQCLRKAKSGRSELTTAFRYLHLQKQSPRVGCRSPMARLYQD